MTHVPSGPHRCPWVAHVIVVSESTGICFSLQSRIPQTLLVTTLLLAPKRGGMVRLHRPYRMHEVAILGAVAFQFLLRISQRSQKRILSGNTHQTNRRIAFGSPKVLSSPTLLGLGERLTTVEASPVNAAVSGGLGELVSQIISSPGAVVSDLLFDILHAPLWRWVTLMKSGQPLDPRGVGIGYFPLAREVLPDRGFLPG